MLESGSASRWRAGDAESHGKFASRQVGLLSYRPNATTICASSVRDRRIDESEKLMKKRSDKNNSQMQPEYDFSASVRGKYACRYAKGRTPKKVSAAIKQTMKDYRNTLRKLA
jgi:hypothetical protein